MKRARWLALVMAGLLAGVTPAAGAAQYEAVVTVDFQLREEAREDARRLRLVAKGSRVQVESIRDGWAHIRAEGREGHARTAWLSRFRSQDPFEHPVPGFQPQAGVARVGRARTLAVPGYEGNALTPGDLLAVSGWDGVRADVAMMRSSAELPADGLIFEPFVPWRQARPGDTLHGFTTFFNQQTGGRLAASRAHNIKLAAGRLDGLVVGPGESFSFNRCCGPYLRSRGYQLAPNISSDGKGYGGGVCQVSTTLYNAALGLPLRIDEWAVHRERGVDYIPQYFDAAVGLYSDLAFTNLLPYPIRLRVLTQEGVLTVLISRAEEGERPAFPQ